ncbi:Got1/Sft2-like family-domain-containing protein [Pilobolus umbonatus]|nr:Got1/Sft2-like family-domain-containing protein [Pilobolus umbonatus]
MSQTENNFKSSLRNFQSSRSTSSAPTSFFQSIRDSASNTFSNVSNTVQGYVPLGTNMEEEEPWYQLSRIESFFCLPLFFGKFAAIFTLGSILVMTSLALLRGPIALIQHMFSWDRLYFSVSYIGSMVLTLYSSLIAHNLILTFIFAIAQIIALICYLVSYIPGGVSTLRYGGNYIHGRLVSLLPI